jgi:hypothetical protein
MNVMTADELDEWCAEISGTVFTDAEGDTVMMLVKEALTRPNNSTRKYRLRLLNLTYLTIGAADEQRIREVFNRDTTVILGKFLHKETKADEFIKDLKAARSMAASYGGD